MKLLVCKSTLHKIFFPQVVTVLHFQSRTWVEYVEALNISKWFLKKKNSILKNEWTKYVLAWEKKYYQVVNH